MDWTSAKEEIVSAIDQNFLPFDSKPKEEMTLEDVVFYIKGLQNLFIRLRDDLKRAETRTFSAKYMEGWENADRYR